MSYNEYDDGERGGPGKLIGLATSVIGVLAIMWFVVIQDDSVTSTQTPAAVSTSAAPTSTASNQSDTADATDATAPSDDTSPDAADASTSATIAAVAATTDDEATPEPVNSDTATPTTPSTEPVPEHAHADDEATYPTLPDGSPVPVLAVFDTDTITLSGVVPSAEAATRLEGLAIANSKFPDAEVVSTLTFDPTIPTNVGIRVVEMNSVRFPESSADLLPEHRAEIDRAAGILALFPNVSVLVIGHADQRGSADSNFKISEERARAVSTYMVSTGLDPSRISSRAVGDLDLLALDNDAQSFALNRRTEFVFYGLLTEPE